MLTTIRCIFVFLLMAVAPLFAQGEATLLFLSVSPSPHHNGMGSAGTALPSDNDHAVYYNPAQLGFSSQETTLSGQVYPGRIDWLPTFNLAELTYNSFAFSAGYNFQRFRQNLPISVGISYWGTNINYGENVLTDTQGNVVGRFTSKESATAISLGIGYHTRLLNLALGMTRKSYDSRLGAIISNGEPEQGKATGSAYDYGLLVSTPLLGLINHFRGSDDNGKTFLPFLDFSLGYARRNVGDPVVYIDRDQGDPLPRNVRLGYALSGGYNLRRGDQTVRLIALQWTVDAEDLLVKPRRSVQDISYTGGLTGDVKFLGNLIAHKPDEEVTIYSGMNVDLMDIFGIRFGGWKGPGFERRPGSFGLSVRLRGFLNYLALDNRSVAYLAEHFDLSYNYAKYSDNDDDGGAGPLSGIKFHGITFTIRNF